jgi:hypothetical protein
MVGAPHASNAAPIPNAASMAAIVGLHPNVVDVPVTVMTGATGSDRHVTVLDALEELPHASIDINVLVCVRLHPSLCTAPSLDTIVGAPHASAEVAKPNAALIAATLGLHPKFVVVPVIEIDGGVRSTRHVAVLDALVILLQPSLAVHVLVCERSHPFDTTAPSVTVIVGAPHASNAAPIPNAASMAAIVGLHPNVVEVPVTVITGATGSDVQVTVLDAEEILLQASLATNVLV